MFDRDGAGIVNVDDADAMRIVDFRLRHRNERTGIADRLAADRLRAMQMAERDISDIRRENVGRNGMFAADENASFGAFQFEPAGDMQMAGDDERRHRRSRAARFRPPRDRASRTERTTASLRSGASTANRPRADRAARANARRRGRDASRIGDEMGACVERAVAARDGADRKHVCHLEQCARRFEPRRGIVIAGDERDRRMRTGGAQVAQRVVEQPLRVGGRVETVENVARDDDRVDRARSFAIATSCASAARCSASRGQPCSVAPRCQSAV